MMKSWTASSPGSLIRVRQATEFNPGRPIELVIDRDVLGWGADWRKAQQEQVARTTFLLAMVTPGCVRSPACQEDFTFFAARGAAREYDGLLTLLVKDPRWEAPDIVDNPVCQEIHEVDGQPPVARTTPLRTWWSTRPGSRRRRGRWPRP